MTNLKSIVVSVSACIVGVGLLAACGTSSESATSSSASESTSREAGVFSNNKPFKLIVSNQTSKDTQIRQYIAPNGAVEAELVSPDELKAQPWQPLDKYSTFRVTQGDKSDSGSLAIEVGQTKDLDRLTFTSPPFKDPRATAYTKIDGKFTRSDSRLNNDPKTYYIYAQPADRIDPKAAESATWTSPATGNKYVFSFETDNQYTTLYLRIKK